MSEFETPMMQQYKQIKSRYPDCLLFFRLGDFYELFLEDAKIGASVLDITLTSRDRGKDGRIPMAGVPFHAVESYLFKLVKAGYKVAICEQMSEPGQGDLVERDVVRVVTPGTVLDENSLDRKENNYLVSISLDEKTLGLALCDVSTGAFLADEFLAEDFHQVINQELPKFSLSECILPFSLYEDPKVLKVLKDIPGLNIYPFEDWFLFASGAPEFLKEHFSVQNLGGFGLEGKHQAVTAAAALIGYLRQTQKNKVLHIKEVKTFEKPHYVDLDSSTIMNLEVFSTLRTKEKAGSLINFLDRTSTSMGGRLLKKWVLHPLLDKRSISERYDAVETFMHNISVRTHLTEVLKEISDLERLLSRISVGVGNAKDLVSLKQSLAKTLHAAEVLDNSNGLLADLQKDISLELAELVNYLDRTFVDNPAFDLKNGGFIKDGVNKDLDELRAEIFGSKEWVANMELKERERTQIGSLKVRFNQVFGYYIEITKANLHAVPKDYMRKQTLVNAERFITPELKHHEEIILVAKEKINAMEYRLFLDAVEEVITYTLRIQKAAHSIASLDCLINFAQISQSRNFVRPVLGNDGVIDIKEGRHPVVEDMLASEPFVPNDVYLNQKDLRLIVITGPNMAGKSVYIRQIALIVLLAQIGCFVPASSARISIVDKIFVRSGASDVISSGLSTFMLEMVETANILNNATDRSLIIMDEIGRGTSTYDGISIAKATAEYLVSDDKLTPLTLFATHYHELQKLEEEYPGKIVNCQVLAEETSEGPVFLHKVVSGGADHSYGIAVARLAGMPESVVARAYEVLSSLENCDYSGEKQAAAGDSTKPGENKVENFLKSIKIENLTPLEALNLLNELKKKV